MKHSIVAARVAKPGLCVFNNTLPLLRRGFGRRILGCAVIVSGLTATAEKADTLDAAAERYRPLMTEEIEHSLDGAQAMRLALLSGGVDEAQKAWIASRVGWERAEVFTSGFTELDREIDAWPNAATGFHAIEAKLFGANRLDVQPETDALIFHLTDLRVKIRDTRLSAQGLLEGAAKLAYEVGESKADGGESRFSGTSLEDMRNNVDGLDSVFRVVFAEALEARDPRLTEEVRANLGELRDLLQVPTLSRLDSGKLRAKSEELIISFQAAAPLLGLRPPSLQDLIQQ